MQLVHCVLHRGGKTNYTSRAFVRYGTQRSTKSSFAPGHFYYRRVEFLIADMRSVCQRLEITIFVELFVNTLRLLMYLRSGCIPVVPKVMYC